MGLCTTCDIIGDYFTKAIQGYQFCHFFNIIIGIHEYEIISYNASRRALLEFQKIKIEREKKETQKSVKLAGDRGNQGVCWEKLVNKLPIHARIAQEGTPDKYYMFYTCIAHVHSLVSIDTLARMLKTFVTCLY